MIGEVHELFVEIVCVESIELQKLNNNTCCYGKRLTQSGWWNSSQGETYTWNFLCQEAIWNSFNFIWFSQSFNLLLKAELQQESFRPSTTWRTKKNSVAHLAVIGELPDIRETVRSFDVSASSSFFLKI